MNLTSDQKKYIRNNYKFKSPEQISENLNIDAKQLEKYIKQKYQYQFKPQIKNPTVLSNKHWIYIFLILLTFCAYFLSINNEFVSDDIDGILKNKNIGNLNFVFSNPKEILNTFVYFTIYKINGLNPAGFRLYNILLHAFSSITIFLILIKLKFSEKISLAASSIFTVHPLLIESVAWISGRPYTQYTLFLFLSFYTYLKSKEHIKFYIISLILFILALMSSEKAIAYPIILLVYELIFNKFLNNWKRLSGYFSILTIGGLYFASKIAERISAVQNLSAGSAGHLLNPLQTIPIAINSYLQMLFLPDGLTLYHSEMTFTINQIIFKQILTLTELLIIIILIMKRQKTIAFLLCWFLIGLMPTLTPLGISWIVAERYVYLSSIGIIILIPITINILLEKIHLQKTFPYIIGIIIILLFAKSQIRISEWKNEDSLWISTAKHSPSSQSTHNNMGDVYARHGDYVNAENEFKKSIAINPNFADAWHNLGLTYQNQGKIDEAIKAYKQAIKIKPQLWQSYENLAQIYFSQNNLKETRKMIEKLLIINPQESSYYVNLGILSISEGKTKEAEEMFTKALKIDPENEKAKNGLKKIQ